MDKFLKLTMKSLIGIGISIILTFMLIMFTPSIFNRALNLWVDLLPSYKFVHYTVQTKEQLAKSFDLKNTHDDAVLFKELQNKLPNYKDKSSLFFRFISVHAYPEPCKFTLIGLHRTINISWRIEGLRCKGKKACELAKREQICPNKKNHN